MTLVVAGISDGVPWFVADSMITGNHLSVRDRQYAVKIEPSSNLNALFAYAGNAHTGAVSVYKASIAKTLEEARAILVEASRVPFNAGPDDGTDFLLATLHDVPTISRIAKGSVREVQRAHIGSHDAFEQLQKIRHAGDPTVPDAIRTILVGAVDYPSVPGEQVACIRQFYDLFASRDERDVGGWAIGYFLTPVGPKFCEYAQSISDPIAKQLFPGVAVPLGTAERGGAAVSVTSLRTKLGMVVYWMPGQYGIILAQQNGSYQTFEFRGMPSAFKAAAEREIGEPINLWLSDPGPPVIPLKRSLMATAEGVPIMSADIAGRAISFTMIDSQNPFYASGIIRINRDE